MKVAFSTLACPDWTWNDLLQNGPAFGFDGVEIRMLDGNTDLLNRPEFQPEQRSRRREELSQAGFEICGLSSSVRFDNLDAEDFHNQIDTGQAYIDLARDLGASFVRVFGDKLPEDATEEQTEKVIQNVADGLQFLGEYAGNKDIDVLIETHGDFSDSRLMQETMKRVSSRAAGVLWDTHHPWRFFAEDLNETWNRLQKWVRHTHWKDSISQPRRKKDQEMEQAAEKAHHLMSGHRHANYVLFGGGEFPVLRCMNLLTDAGYNGWFCLEWEKAWHPELEDPEVALPLLPPKIREFWEISKSR